MAKHAFLSDDWFDEAEKIVAAADADAPAHASVVVNLVVKDTPSTSIASSTWAPRTARASSAAATPTAPT